MLLVAVSHRAAGFTGELDLPRRSDFLKEWALPFMAKALAEDEDEQAALELFNRVKNLSRHESKHPSN